MRLRFAPSPTGTLHLGNARTALVNWLVARQSAGTLVLRVEDTDLRRNVEGSEAELIADLAWLGLDWDEGPDVGGPMGPYRQSERSASYRAAIDALLTRGAAYPCFCAAGADREGDGADPHGYPGTCRSLPVAEVRSRVEAGERHAVRLRVPMESGIRFVDGLRGETGVAAGELGDFVIARSDGSPTYLLAAVVDDHEMQVDHVIRGQDHLSNTPRQLLLYAALGWVPPRFTHLPLVLGPDRSRLSKRHGAASVAEMRARGILPAALANYLALLGWAPPEDREVLTPVELVELFRLDGLSPVNVVFDETKLEWLNQQHLGRLGPDELLARAEPFLAAAGVAVGAGPEREWWRDLIGLIGPSCRRLDELPARLAPILELPAVVERPGGDGRAAVEGFLAAAEAGELGDAERYRAAARAVADRTGCRGRALFQPLRIALTGEEHGPELARLVPLLARASALELTPAVPGAEERLRAALETA